MPPITLSERDPAACLEHSDRHIAVGSVATYYHEASPLRRQSKGCGFSYSGRGGGYNASLAFHPIFHFHERVPRAMDNPSSSCLLAEKFPTCASDRQDKVAITLSV